MVEFSIIPQDPKERELHDEVINWTENFYNGGEELSQFEHLCTRSFQIANGRFLFIFSAELNGIDRICDIWGEYDSKTFEIIGVPNVIFNQNIWENN